MSLLKSSYRIIVNIKGHVELLWVLSKWYFPLHSKPYCCQVFLLCLIEPHSDPVSGMEIGIPWASCKAQTVAEPDYLLGLSLLAGHSLLR